MTQSITSPAKNIIKTQLEMVAIEKSNIAPQSGALASNAYTEDRYCNINNCDRTKKCGPEVKTSILAVVLLGLLCLTVHGFFHFLDKATQES